MTLCPHRFSSRQEAAHIVAACPTAKWVFKPASLHRTGINRMFNHGPEWWLVGVLDIVLVRVPAEIAVKFDGVNIKTMGVL